MLKTFEEFKNEMETRIPEYLPEEYRSCRVRTFVYRRPGLSYTALNVQLSGKACPMLNLDDVYRIYLDTGNMEEILRDTAEFLVDGMESLDLVWLTDYKAVKGNLFVCLSSASKDQEFLQECPHQIVEDLAVTCYIRITQTNDGGLFKIKVTNSLLGSYGITEDELFRDAFDNAKKLFPASLQPMDEIIKKSVANDMKTGAITKADADEIMEELEMKKEITPMWVLTNDQKLNGSAVLFYPGIMDLIGSKLGNFYIIPSSIHEMLLIPERKNDFDVEGFRQIVVSQNSAIDPRDVLSEEIYHYDVKKKKFENAKNYIERKMHGEKTFEYMGVVPCC